MAPRRWLWHQPAAAHRGPGGRQGRRKPRPGRLLTSVLSTAFSAIFLRRSRQREECFIPIRANKGLGIRDSKERETADVALKESPRMQEKGGGENPSQPLSRSVLRDNRALWSPSCGRHFVQVSSLFIYLASLRTLASSGRAHDPLRAPLPCAAGWAGGREGGGPAGSPAEAAPKSGRREADANSPNFCRSLGEATRVLLGAPRG